MQIIFFILLVAFILFLIVIAVIGANVMRLVLWLRNLFIKSGDRQGESTSETKESSTNGPQVIGDDEGEYIDFEELK